MSTGYHLRQAYTLPEKSPHRPVTGQTQCVFPPCAFILPPPRKSQELLLFCNTAVTLKVSICNKLFAIDFYVGARAAAMQAGSLQFGQSVPAERDGDESRMFTGSSDCRAVVQRFLSRIHRRTFTKRELSKNAGAPGTRVHHAENRTWARFHSKRRSSR